MNKHHFLYLPVIFLLVMSCDSSKANQTTDVSVTSGKSNEHEKSAASKSTTAALDSVKTNQDTPSLFKGNKLKTEDYIQQYPGGEKSALKSHIEWLRQEWKNVPNPITVTYEGNDFGDYHHVIFKAANGVEYDFGQANNSYGKYKLHDFSEDYDDNPEYLGKKFKVFWDWKLSEFSCCEGEYGVAKAYVPSITKLELVKD